MIRHCVFINFQSNITQSHKAELFNLLDALKLRLSGILSVNVGSNVSPESGMDKGYSDGFIIDFATAADRDNYLVDPEHQRIGAELVNAAEGGVDGILVFDLSVSD